MQLPSHCSAAMLCLLFTRSSQREPRCPPPSALPGVSPKPFSTPNRMVWGPLPSLESPAPYAMGVKKEQQQHSLSFAMEGGAPARRLAPLLPAPS